jgi:hypothetical protein
MCTLPIDSGTCLRALPQLHGRPPAPVRAHGGRQVSRQGAFAVYVVLPMTNVWHHAPDIDREVAAIFDPLGSAVHTALSFNVLGEDVLITGAGPIGLVAAAVVRHAGARHVVITDVNPRRLALAEQMGLTRSLDPRDASLEDVQRDLGMQEGFDVALEMSGSPAALHDMLANMAHGGRIAMLGIPADEIAIDWSTAVLNMLTIKGIYGREMYETWYAVMLQSGLDIRPVVTHRCGRRARGDPRRGALQGRRDPPARRRRGAQLLREHLPRPGRRPGDRRRGPGRSGGVGLRPRLGALHLRHPGHPQAARRPPQRVPGHRGHHPLRLVLRRQRRALRDAAGRGGRRHQRRAQPRVGHRRHPALQGAAAALRQRRHGRAGGAARGGGRRPAHPDRHRRRVFDRRVPRPAGPHLQSSPTGTARW